MTAVYEHLYSLIEVPVYHLALELFLVVWVLSVLLKKSYNPRLPPPLTEQEKDELVAEWTPEPLVSNSDASLPPVEYPVLDGKAGKYLKIDGATYLNVATCDFLGSADDPRVQHAAIQCLRKYGVGSCGPRAFFGTLDVHLDTEQRIGRFLGTEETCLYSLAFSTIASAIPAYAKRSDIIYADECVCFAIQKGLQASRSRVVYYRHNDAQHLAALLHQQLAVDKQSPKKAAVVRKFLVTEAVFAKSGQLCCLPQLVALKKQFRLRLFIDESLSFGVLGATGRGITEHFGVQVDDVDLIAAGLEAAMGSTGGFTTGSLFIVQHQRLSGSGYVFSASLAPLCAAVARKVIDLIDEQPHMVSELRRVCLEMHAALADIAGLRLESATVSPVKFLCLAESSGGRQSDLHVLHNIANTCMDAGVAVTVPRYLEREEHTLPPPSLRVTCSRLLHSADIRLVRETIAAAALRHISSLTH